MQAIELYFSAGAKFLELCQQTETENGKNAATYMFAQTAGFLQQCAQACFKHKEDELKGALFLKWAAICFARSFHIKRDKIKQHKKEVAAYLTQLQQSQSHPPNSTTASSSSTSSTSTSTPPTIPSPASTPPSPGPSSNAGSAGSTSMIAKNLQTLEDMYELVKMTELWSRSELINNSSPIKLDPLPDFVNIDTTQAIDYVKSQVSRLKK